VGVILSLITQIGEQADYLRFMPTRPRRTRKAGGQPSLRPTPAGNPVETGAAHHVDVMNIRPDPWFATEEVEPGTWLVGEPGHVNCFLVEGSERAVLVDTGLGLADIGAAARGLTDKPILVVNTHSHSDHRGGNWRFADVAAHPLALGPLARPVDQDYLAGYLAVARDQLTAYQRVRKADDRFFHQFTAATRLRPLPEDAGQWTVPGGPVPRALADGERIDLGGREVTVLYTPGHSPDSLCLLDERAGLLFAGDTLITGDFWAHTPDTEIEVFAATLRKLADELADGLSAIYPAHTLRYRARPGLLTAAADAFTAVIDGTSTGTPGSDLLLRPATRHEFDEFSVLRPPA
jgi:glyoxylase-like metal-dependent hydrolase (beta-lactamase superfamily II)